MASLLAVLAALIQSPKVAHGSAPAQGETRVKRDSDMLFFFELVGWFQKVTNCSRQYSVFSTWHVAAVTRCFFASARSARSGRRS